MKKHIALSFVAFALAACSDDKPSNALFEETINQFAEQEGVCLPLVLNIQNPSGRDSFRQIPLGSSEIQIIEANSSGNAINQSALKQLDFLADEGFYKKSETDIQLNPKSSETTTALVYRITEKGQKQTRTPKDAIPHFCVGHQKVEKINWYTEPSASNNMTVSRVSYEARFVAEKWLAELMKVGGGKLPLDEIHAQTATLIKTNEGWKDARELR